jgi:hypothetical protein
MCKKKKERSKVNKIKIYYLPMFSQSWSRARRQSGCRNPEHDSVPRALLLVAYIFFLFLGAHTFFVFHEHFSKIAAPFPVAQSKAIFVQMKKWFALVHSWLRRNLGLSVQLTYN